MTRCFIDSNIWLRFILKDNDQYPSCYEFISRAANAVFHPHTSSLVLLEIDYLLTRTFKVSKSQSCLRLDAIASIPGITIINQTDYQKALQLYRQTKVKFADCLIASQIPQNTILVTYDRDFQKIPGITTLNPSQFLQQL